MALRPCLAGLAILWACTAAHAVEECPVTSNGMDEIIATLNQAQGCDRAMTLFEACQYGTSADAQFGAVVEKKCEADFLAGLKAAAKRGYQRDLTACDRKYRNQSGTMGISFTAFCRAEAAQRYSRRALSGAAPGGR